MVGRGRSEENLLLPFPLAALAGAVGIQLAAGRSIELAAVAAFWIMGLLIGFLPYMALAVPACLFFERNGLSPPYKTGVLTAGGMAIGHLLGFGFLSGALHSLWVWALVIGGCSGLLLGFLRN
ncbi:hypothetical protein [Sphingomonas glaciei]|uniref:Major facilitator superfamily (MFS) profile domain-containing protein n=1 Tax=Sphingomonas glaciei TaxID=2938948 RepID=A0ABY5MSK8_9SPHN|nr:hypothetical protein [Sphingomonas glaciei]UUR07027.1 hypothetical protein M1K48_08685 [Sphingomonas glaciei]